MGRKKRQPIVQVITDPDQLKTIRKVLQDILFKQQQEIIDKWGTILMYQKLIATIDHEGTYTQTIESNIK